MLRRSPYNVCFPILRSRPLVLPSVRLASFKVDKAKAKDAPATRADHKIARHTPVPPTPNDDESSEETMRERVTRIVQWAVVAFLAFHVCTEFFYLPTGAYGVSMLPTLNSSGDLLLISKLYRKGRKVEVGDLVSYKHPLRPGEFAIKRVLGLAGDFVLMYTPGKSDTMIQVGLAMTKDVSKTADEFVGPRRSLLGRRRQSFLLPRFTLVWAPTSRFDQRQTDCEIRVERDRMAT